MPNPKLSSLDAKITSTLDSRSNRGILRRLPASPESDILNFTSNDYLALSASPKLRQKFLSRLQSEPQILGSGGSRLLVNGPAHSGFESRLRKFFRAEAALLFNSGFDANVGFFSCVSQPGDIVLYDELIHASVHDGLKLSRVSPKDRISFSHNSEDDLRVQLEKLILADRGIRNGVTSVFIAVESLYSMDGTFAPLQEIVNVLDELFPRGNAYLIVDEAHSTGVYGPKSRGRVAMLGLEDKVFARLHTFGKALAATGAVLLTTPLVRSYLINYARSLIYTTSLSTANVILADCVFDMLEDGTTTKLSNHLLSLSSYFIHSLSPHLLSIPPTRLQLPAHLLPDTCHDTASQIIPLLTRTPHDLSTYLLQHCSINARPITWPTVPKGRERVRICLNAGHSREDVRRLVEGVLMWARTRIAEEVRSMEAGGEVRAKL